MSRKKVIINIATCKRPKMLEECIHSILRQEIPASWDVVILIIDNDPSATIQPAFIDQLAISGNITLSYVQEKRPGIPFARNHGCTISQILGADFLIFIDDDETAEPGWLMAFEQAIQTYTADAYSGPVRYVYPETHVKWLQNKNEMGISDGTSKKRASTNNVLIQANILSPRHYNLTFDPGMAFTGGSDSDFFMRLVHAGGKIVHVSQAIVKEEVLSNRLTIKWRLQRQFRSSTNRVYINMKLYGQRKSIISALKEAARHCVEGTLGFIVSPLFLLSGYYKFKRQLYHSLRHLAKGAGNICGLFGAKPQPYKIVDGY